jgi:hypothetical protein
MKLWSDAGSKYFFMPIGPWKPESTTLRRLSRALLTHHLEVTETEKELSILVLKDMSHIANAGRPLLIAQGYEAETVDDWIASAHAELSRSNLKHQNAGVRTVADIREIALMNSDSFAHVGR